METYLMIPDNLLNSNWTKRVGDTVKWPIWNETGMNNLLEYASKDLQKWWSIQCQLDLASPLWMPWPRKSKLWQGHPLAIVAWRPSRETINLPASSKGCCLNSKGWCPAPLIIHSAPLGRSRYKNFINIFHIFIIFPCSFVFLLAICMTRSLTGPLIKQQHLLLASSGLLEMSPTSPSHDPNLSTNHPPESMARTARAMVAAIMVPRLAIFTKSKPLSPTSPEHTTHCDRHAGRRLDC